MDNKSKNNSRSAMYLAALMAGTALSTGGFTSALAQDEQTDSRRDTIVVTATRREETVSDVPYNISAVGGGDIEQANMLDEAELLRSVPGIAVVDRGARNSGTMNSARIRGIAVDGNGLGDYAVSSVASVSTYVNDTPVFANFSLVDLERVEVLRGPQGTLYGSGSLGGTIRYITRDPVFGETGGYVRASLSSTDGSSGYGRSVNGALNIPMGENAALRLVGNFGDYDGITDYVNVYQLDAAGAPVAPNGLLDPAGSYEVIKDADTVETRMGRGTFLWEPTDTMSLRLVHARQSDDVGGRRHQTLGQDGWGRDYDRYENGSVQLEPSSREVNATSLEIEMDLGFATLTSSSSHYDHTGDSTSENTGFYAQAGWLPWYYNHPRPMAQAVRTYADEAVVQEIRLVSDDGGDFDYVVGGFYRRQQIESTQNSYLSGFKAWWDTYYPAGASWVAGDQDWAYRRTENFTETAFFGELTWHASEDLDLTFGGRYFDNESENDTFMSLPLWVGLFPDVDAQFASSENDMLFKLNLAYRLNDEDMFYATISEGYRRGGSNAVPLTGLYQEDASWQLYTSDTVINYEAGFKGDRGDFRYDISAFYVDWADPQLNTATSNWGFFAVQNGSEARSYGIEASIDGFVGNNWHYSLGYALINAELGADIFAPNAPAPAAPVALSGAMLPGTPEHQLNWAVDYTSQIGNWDWFTRLDGYYQSETRNGVTTAPKFNVPIDGFAIWNLTSTFSQGDFDLSFWMKNITNEEGTTGVFTEAYMGTSPANNYFGNGSKEMISLPRTIGATLRYNF